MNEFKIIVKLLLAIRESEEKPTFDPAFVSERVLGTTAQHRDNLAILLKNEGYITGLNTTEDIDGVKLHRVFWEASRPAVTLSGLEYMAENKTFHKALDSLVRTGEAAASVALQAALSQYL